LDIYYDFFQKNVSILFPIYSDKEINFILTAGWSKEKLKKSIEQNRKDLFAAFDKNKIVGIFETEKPFMGVCFAVWLMVDKKYQSKGIGTKLIEAFENNAIKLGAHSTYLYTDNKNLDFYKNRGYEFVGVHKKAWLGYDHYYFGKQIAEPKEENYLKVEK
jgi:GNAT superfamily N-acetyltransferase